MYEYLGIKSPSAYQIPIFDHIEKAVRLIQAKQKPKSLIVRATAGSGKTTTLVAAARLIPNGMTASFFAFGKAIADELKTRLPEEVKASTLHALGNSILSAYVKTALSKRVEVDGDLFYEHARKVIPKHHEFLLSDVRFMVSQAKANGLVPDQAKDAQSVPGVQDTQQFWIDLLDHFGRTIDDPRKPEDQDVDAFDLALSYTRKILRRGLQDITRIDFDDQLYLPCVKLTPYGTQLPVKRLQVVMVDEVQDLNLIQRILIQRVLDPNGLGVFIGDENQSIHGWRGADNESMARIQEEFDCVSLPLSVSYRCPRRVVEHANELVEEIKWADGAKDGLVEWETKYGKDLFGPNDLIMCRNNAPLVSFAYKLIRARIACKVLGRDIGKGLIDLIARLDHQESIPRLAEQLSLWHSQQIEIVLKQKPERNEALLAALKDRVDCINAFISDTSATTVAALVEEIRSLFGDEKSSAGMVVLSSIHRAKGMEADHTFVLDHQLMYPKWVSKDTWQYQQEQNVDFVSRTRARKSLRYISSLDYEG